MTVQVSQEAVDHALRAGVVLEGLAHDLAGQGRGQRADLALELRGGLLTLGGTSVVDGGATGMAASIGGLSATARRVQNGFVRSYALALLGGAALVLLALVVVSFA